jgi:ATP-dependent 26S proteasome regulatory subunit/intein/homing endonuclease
LPVSNVDAELETLIRARYPILYVVSWEEKRVEESLRKICAERGWGLTQWTATTGLGGDISTRDPLMALDKIAGAADRTVFLFKDFHPFINEVVTTRKLRDLVTVLKTSIKTIVFLSPTLKLPTELEKEITVVDYQLPSVDDLDQILEKIIQGVKDNPKVDVKLTQIDREQILKAASGLTSNEAENVFARSLVDKRKFDIDVILGEKEQIIRKSGILEYFPASEAFSNVGGVDLLKGWMSQRTASFSDEARKFGLPEPKGVLLLGVQGCGKSLIAKAIGSLWKLPLLRLDVGKIFAGIVGSSEENMRKAIGTAESVAPCVTGDTRITLSDGSERTIQSLYDGQEKHLSVLGMSDAGTLIPVRVQAITRREAPDLFTIKMRHAILQATSNHEHPILRNGVLEWVRSDNLQVNDFVAMPRHLPTESTMPKSFDFLPEEIRCYLPDALGYARPDVITPQRRYSARERGGNYVKKKELAETLPHNLISQFVLGKGGTTDSTLNRLPEILNTEVGYLMGLIESDGYISKRNRIGFVNTDRTLHSRFADILCSQFALATHQHIQAEQRSPQLVGTSIDSVFQPCYVTYADNRLLAKFLRAIESNLLTLPKPFLQAYIRGYFDGDGCISDATTTKHPRVTLTSKIPVINQRVRSVLHRVGFPTSNPGSANIEITGWANVQRFITEIGSEHPCRAARMEQWQERQHPEETKDRTDVIPIGGLLRQVREAIGMRTHYFTSASSSLMHYYETEKGHPSRARLQTILSEMQNWVESKQISDEPLQPLANLLKSDFTWTQVLSVEKAETPEFVYDLVCEETHNFIANGVVTHNCILWLDELEKGFSGTQSSGMSDGGTTSRVFSTFLTWLSEKKAPVFVIATSNDVSALPPELLRKGRFDDIFFVDLPSLAERKEIFEIHLKKRFRDPKDFDTEVMGMRAVGYSGAEIEQAVVSALFIAFGDNKRELIDDDIFEVIETSVPLAVTMHDKIQALRDWATDSARRAASNEVETMADMKRKEVELLARRELEAAQKPKEVIAKAEPKVEVTKAEEPEKPKATRKKPVAKGDVGQANEYEMDKE